MRTIPTGGRNGSVIGLAKVSDESEILLIDTNGKVIRLSPQEVRSMGRQAKGVRLVRLDEGQELCALLAFEPEGEINALTAEQVTAQVPEGTLLQSQEDKLLLEEDYPLEAEELYADDTKESDEIVG